MKYLLWIAIAAASLNYTYAQSKDDISMKFKFKKGETLKYVMIVSSQTDTVGVKSTLEQVYTITETVTNVDDKGTATIKLKYENIRHKFSAPMKNVTFDSSSASDVKKAKNNPSISMLANIVGKDITIKVKGDKLVDIDLKAIKDALSNESDKEGKIAFIDSSIRNFTNTFLPRKTLKRGDTWGQPVKTFLPTFGALDVPFLKINADAHYKLEDVATGKSKVARIGLNAKLNVQKTDDFAKDDDNDSSEKNGEANGTILFSIGKGQLLKSSITQSFTLDMQAPLGRTIQSNTVQKIEIELK